MAKRTIESLHKDALLTSNEEEKGALRAHAMTCQSSTRLNAMIELARILTATRSGEVLGARWSEIDFEAKVWTVPASRMKAAREHRIPLSDRVLKILEMLVNAKTGDFIFPGQRNEKPLSVMAMEMVLRRMKFDGVTVHGFRSAFRDWAGNETHFPREIAEAALAHVIGDKAEQAYRRGDALEKQRALMEAWAGFCEPKAGSNVISLTRASI